MASVVGRPRVSPVRDYFEFDAEEDKSVWKVTKRGGEECGTKFSGKFPTNLRKHLQKFHTEAYIELLSKEQEREKEKVKSKQSVKSSEAQKTIESSFLKAKKYDKGSDRYKKISRKLAIFVGTTNVSNSLVCNNEFKEFVHELDARYEVPGRTVINKELDMLLEELKGKISSLLDEAGRIAITVDIWTKKGMTESFLGMTAHFFSKKNHKRYRPTIAVKNFPTPHTANRVLDSVRAILQEWNIPEAKVSRVLSDNGSNMVAAFKDLKDSVLDGESVTSDTTDSSPESISGDSSSQSGEDEDALKYMEKDAEEEIAQFEEQEFEHELAFTAHFKRVSCFAHTLQLVVRKFDTFQSVKKVFCKAHRLVSKFNKSCKATERLVQLAGKKLTSDCPTQWSSSFLMVSRLLQLKLYVAQVCEELSWDSLQNSDWKVLETYRELLDPFARYTSLESAEDVTTVSSVFPIVLELSMHLEEMRQRPGLASVASCLLNELNRRFMKVKDPKCPDFDPLFVAATFLDCHYKLLLDSEQIEAAKKLIVSETEISSSRDGSKMDEGEEQTSELEVKEPPLKCFKHLSAVIAKKKEQAGTAGASQTTSVEEELTRYHLEQHVDFWVDVEGRFPTLSSVAYNILSILASSAPVERVFSTSGESCIGK